MTDYTQHGEQKYFLEVLGALVPNTQPGRLLEIGAWEPKTFSNSRALIELGQSGIRRDQADRIVMSHGVLP